MIGSRLDRKLRPELSRGSVDFLVGPDFSFRPIQEPVYVYAIDISPRAIASGLTMAAIHAVRSSLTADFGSSDGINPWDKVRVGILTFHHSIQYYNINENSRDPVKIMIVNSEDPIAALPPHSWLLATATQMRLIHLLLETLPSLIASLQQTPSDETGAL